MEDIIKLARQAGGTPYVNRHYPGETSFAFGPEAFKTFARLVAEKATEEANARANASWTLMCKKMVAAERDACAEICDRFQARDVGMQPAECAGAIRARGQE